MHHPSFLAGLELGKFLTRLRLKRIMKDMDARAGRMRRMAILVTLWTLALLANLSADRTAEFAVEVMREAFKR